MRHVENIPICSNTLFIYKLDIKKDLTLKFKKEKFGSVNKPFESSASISEDVNVLRKYKELNKEIKKL